MSLTCEVAQITRLFSLAGLSNVLDAAVSTGRAITTQLASCALYKSANACESIPIICSCSVIRACLHGANAEGNFKYFVTANVEYFVVLRSNVTFELSSISPHHFVVRAEISPHPCHGSVCVDLDLLLRGAAINLS